MKQHLELSDHLESIAQLMQLENENVYKIRAYLQASLLVKNVPYEKLDDPTRLTGIGPSIGTTIKEFLLRGSSIRFENLSKKWNPSILEMMKIRGIGPKRAIELFKGGITTYDALLNEANHGNLPKHILTAVFESLSEKNRIPIEVVKPVGEKVKEALLKSGASRVEICGSLRRNAPTCKDIDVLVENDNSQEDFKFQEAIKNLGDVLWNGPIKTSIIYQYDLAKKIQIDFWIVRSWYWGSAINYATGNKNHNQRLRTLAKTRDARLNEYGIFSLLGGENFDHKKITFSENGAFSEKKKIAERVAGKTEEEIYAFLNMEYIYPSQRLQ